MNDEAGAGETARKQAWRYGIRMRAAIRAAGISESDPLRPLLDGLASLPLAVHDAVEGLHEEVRRQVRDTGEAAVAGAAEARRRFVVAAVLAACGVGVALGGALSPPSTAAIEAAVARQFANHAAE